MHVFMVAEVAPRRHQYPAEHKPDPPGDVPPAAMYRPGLKNAPPSGAPVDVTAPVTPGHQYPAEQRPVHEALLSPSDEPYVPAGHGRAATPTQYCPNGQRLSTSCVGEVLPALQKYPSVHAPHAAADVRPVLPPYVPGGQGVATRDPGTQ